jgi:glycosyltransferase involved in cell wall biosynthesis
MTLLSKLGYIPNRQRLLISPLLKSTGDVTIIIPVKNNQEGIDTFLNAFFQTHLQETLPREIIIVDNNSNPEIKLNTTFPTPIHLVKCKKIGPASARNYGARLAKSEWIYFTDSDCIPTKSTLTGYLKNQNGSVGYAGNIKANRQGLISKYYETQEILIPPKIYGTGNTFFPHYLITANCLVWRQAFEKANGFNERIHIAGGEDIDLGFKLLQFGKLSYSFESLVFHNFDEKLGTFKERFRRYGKGNKIISELYDLNLKPTPFIPNKKSLSNYILAFIQYLSLCKGYHTRNN